MSCCQPEELEVLSQVKTAQVYQRGQVIFQENGRPMGLYCIHSGKIKVMKVGGDGKEQIIRLAREGDLLGYRGLLAGNSHSASAVALEESVVCCIPRTEFFRLIEQNMRFATSLMQLLSRALGDAEERMLHLAYKPVRERLAEALLLLARTYQQQNQEPVSIPISRDDLASLVGTAKETTSRFVSEFRDEGVLQARGSLITILNPARLAEISTRYD